MYDDDVKQNIYNSLEEKTISITSTAIALASQGYLINKSKYIRLDWSSIMVHAFENIDVLNTEQQNKIEILYNKLSTI